MERIIIFIFGKKLNNMDLHKRIIHINDNIEFGRKIILMGELESLKEQYTKLINISSNILENEESKYFGDLNKLHNRCLTAINFSILNTNFNIIDDLKRINGKKIRGYRDNILYHTYSHILIELGVITRENTPIKLVDHSVLNKHYNCYFCNSDTQHWHEKTKTPVCKSCGDSHNSNLYVEDTILKHL